MLKITLYLTFICLSLNSIAQSPWVNKKGSVYGQLSTSYLAYSNIFNTGPADIVESNYETKDITIGLYGEYSLSNKTSVILDLPFKNVQANNQILTGFGDPTIKIKHQISNKTPIAIYYGYTAPLSQRNGILRTGYKKHIGELGLSTGIGKEKYYVYGGFGYRYREQIPNQIIIDSEFGYKLQVAKRTLFLMLHIGGSLNTSTTEDPDGDETVLYHNNGQYLSPGLKLAYSPFQNLWINFGANFAITARNMGAAPLINFGLAYNLKK
jgi:hypothetical protein